MSNNQQSDSMSDKILGGDMSNKLQGGAVSDNLLPFLLCTIIDGLTD